jgi:hypothetical protein
MSASHRLMRRRASSARGKSLPMPRVLGFVSSEPILFFAKTGGKNYDRIRFARMNPAGPMMKKPPEFECPRILKAAARARLLGIAIAIVTSGLLAPGSMFGWGPTAHHIVNGWAILTLPPEMRGFFTANRQFILDHANDPDTWMKNDRYERKRHYIYLDKYGVFPYLTLPHAFKRATEQFGSGRVNRDGVLPWQIGEYSLRLTNAMKLHNWDEAKLDAAVLAHYVADAHQPLHTTQNFDGQLSEQPGLADRFEIRLVDRYSKFFILHPEDAVKIDDPTEYAFQICLEAHTWVESVILADRKAREGLLDFTDDYFDRFYSQVSTTVMREINTAAHDAGSYLYTAWVNAGQPALPGR